MIYFDNSATTFPKPEAVQRSVLNSIKNFSANPGRAGHTLAVRTAEEVFDTRQKAAAFFGAESEENVIFTQNCTAALNFVIKGLAKKNSHFVVSSLEHNAVLRPLERLKREGLCDYSIAEVKLSDDETAESFKSKIRDNTVAVVCTAASNVFGKRLPLKMLSELCKSKGIVFAVDGAQCAGITDLNCKKDGIDFLCIAAHKGLYAPMGIGMLIINSDRLLNTLIEGGTGTQSESLLQPEFLPERFESGTLSVPLISGLKAGVEFTGRQGVGRIFEHEDRIIKYIFSEMLSMKNVLLYTNVFSAQESFVPILSFNIKGRSSEETAALLSEKGICVRAGFHCAFLAHRHYRTDKTGTVRISPSVFTEKKDVKYLLNSVFEIAK
ncbi:MAG: aminotransferase class V-fold PLP-dependent enzyme [Ruminococcaceae bacterium]|nr:aminotransferase class V-fold PLP-dependent enzyme [Oscillospiraceae bacterium]